MQPSEAKLTFTYLTEGWLEHFPQDDDELRQEALGWIACDTTLKTALALRAAGLTPQDGHIRTDWPKGSPVGQLGWKVSRGYITVEQALTLKKFAQLQAGTSGDEDEDDED